MFYVARTKKEGLVRGEQISLYRRAEEDFSEAELYPAWRVPLVFEGLTFGRRDDSGYVHMLFADL